MSSSANPLTGLARTPFMATDGQTVSWSWMQFFFGIALAKNVPTFLTNTHANRSQISAQNYANGTLFFETDRGVVYTAVNGTWYYFAGTMQVEQAALPTDLALTDVNFLASVTDYAHLLMWTGKGWTWASSEDGSDKIVLFLNGPNPQTGWQVCDGSTNIPVLQFDGTLNFVTVPTNVGWWYRQ